MIDAASNPRQTVLGEPTWNWFLERRGDGGAWHDISRDTSIVDFARGVAVVLRRDERGNIRYDRDTDGPERRELRGAFRWRHRTDPDRFCYQES